MSPELYPVLLVPVIVAGLAYAVARRRPGPWGFASLPAGPLVAIVVACVADTTLTSDTELWTGFAAEVAYRESYTETVSETYTENGKTKTRQRTVHHGPEYWLVDTNDLTVMLNEKEYVRLARKWGAVKPPVEGFFTSGGATHKFKWPGDEASAEVVATAHRYRNPVAAAGSVFDFVAVPAEEVSRLGLFKRPSFVGPFSVPASYNLPEAGEVARLNARLGRSHQVRVTALGFQGRGPEAAVAQEAFWKGGPKNGLTVCVGLDGDRVTWVRAFCWGNEEVRAKIAAFPTGRPYDGAAFATFLTEVVSTSWHRKPFADFDYLTVETPGWAVLLAYLLAAGAGVGVVIVDLNTRVPVRAKGIRIESVRDREMSWPRHGFTPTRRPASGAGPPPITSRFTC